MRFYMTRDLGVKHPYLDPWTTHWQERLLTRQATNIVTMVSS